MELEKFKAACEQMWRDDQAAMVAGMEYFMGKYVEITSRTDLSDDQRDTALLKLHLGIEPDPFTPIPVAFPINL